MALNQKEESIQLGPKETFNLIFPFIRKKISEQIKSVFLIVSYLIAFQILILHLPLVDAVGIALGIAIVVIGLAFFMEGLFLGLMPLGESLGIRLPQKSNLTTILIFSFLLGAGTTLAEPAIGVLKTAGSFVQPWDAPLLYLLLNRMADSLVYSVGIGVGFAVVFGMLRFLYGWSLKPLILILLTFLLPLTLYSYFNENLRHITGLAWDCGAVTTGPVTVPLVVALGIGISRVTSDSGGGSSGFGVVTLASLFPILSVLLLGILFLPKVPLPMDKDDFLYLKKEKEKILYVLGGEEGYNQFISEYSGVYLEPTTSNKPKPIPTPAFSVQDSFIKSLIASLQAIIPLTGFLFLFLLFVLKEKLRNSDEVFLGIILAVLGMSLFNLGIELGLGKLGNQVGSKLPSAFRSIPLLDKEKEIENFDVNIVQTSIDAKGNQYQFFFYKENNTYRSVPFSLENYDPETKTYRYIPHHGPIYGSENGIWGYLVVLIFAFVMGYGATLAEPALNALGVTVEEITVGTFKKSSLMQAVSIGVGAGILLGVSKILFNIPIAFLLVPFYIALLIITFISSEEYVNIGWDSAGVTTGPITVPLVLAMGLGVGGQVGVVEGFGILAMASVCPILSVLGIGLWVESTRKQSLEEEDENEEENQLDELINQEV